MERRLTFRENFLLKLHVWVCMWCQWYMEQLQLMRDGLRASLGTETEAAVATSSTLSDEARERIRRKLTNSH
jgi:hypothetical protein